MEFEVLEGFKIEIDKILAEKLGIADGDELEQLLEGDCIVIRKR